MKFNFCLRKKKVQKRIPIKSIAKFLPEKNVCFNEARNVHLIGSIPIDRILKRYMFCKINIIKTCNILRYHLIYLIMMEFASLADWIVKWYKMRDYCGKHRFAPQ